MVCSEAKLFGIQTWVFTYVLSVLCEKGEIIMHKNKSDIRVGTIHSSNKWGDFEIVEYVSSIEVKIRFLDTNAVTFCRAKHIRDGCVKDVYAPSVCGVGYLGEGVAKVRENKLKTKVYEVWTDMIKRCYNDTFTKKNPNYAGVTVCPEWHNFNTFSLWFNDNYKEGYHLDKDIGSRGFVDKVYSPTTCRFISQYDNSVEANAKSWTFVNPDGEVIDIYNLSVFCENNNLNRGCMRSVRDGKVLHHRGWTKPTSYTL